MPGYQKTYAIPDAELALLRQLGQRYADARSPPDGHLSSWIERKRFQRDGAQWVTVQERGQGWAVELALDEGGEVVEVRPLSAEQARQLEPNPT